MIVLLVVFLVLLQAPCLVVSFVLQALVDRKGRNANPREAEMIGTVEMTGFGMRVGTNGEPKVLGSRFDNPIETGALRARDLDFFGRPKRRQIIVVQIERDSP